MRKLKLKTFCCKKKCFGEKNEMFLKKWNETRNENNLMVASACVCVRVTEKDMRRRKRGACTVILTDYITGSKRMRELFKLNKKKFFRE